MNGLKIFIFVWFAVAIVVELFSSLVLFFWLRRHGVKLVFGLTGLPGYMERAYYIQCCTNGRPCKTVLILRTFSVINLIVSAIVTIPVLASM